jgi:hypothetical protein
MPHLCRTIFFIFIFISLLFCNAIFKHTLNDLTFTRKQSRERKKRKNSPKHNLFQSTANFIALKLPSLVNRHSRWLAFSKSDDDAAAADGNERLCARKM